MSTALARFGNGLRHLLGAADRLELEVGPGGPSGDFSVPSDYDGTWETVTIAGRSCLRPTESAYYLYAALPDSFRRRAGGGLWVEVEYYGGQYGEFRLQYASTDRSATEQGLYKAAAQRWQPDAVGLRRFRRALFLLPDFDASRSQNLGASFRFEFRRELLLTKLAVSLAPPPDLESFPVTAPVPARSCRAASIRSSSATPAPRRHSTTSST